MKKNISLLKTCICQYMDLMQWYIEETLPKEKESFDNLWIVSYYDDNINDGFTCYGRYYPHLKNNENINIDHLMDAINIIIRIPLKFPDEFVLEYGNNDSEYRAETVEIDGKKISSIISDKLCKWENEYLKFENKKLLISKKDFVIESFCSEENPRTKVCVKIKHLYSNAEGESTDLIPQWKNERKAFIKLIDSTEFKNWLKIECIKRNEVENIVSKTIEEEIGKFNFDMFDKKLQKWITYKKDYGYQKVILKNFTDKYKEVFNVLSNY